MDQGKAQITITGPALLIRMYFGSTEKMSHSPQFLESGGKRKRKKDLLLWLDISLKDPGPVLSVRVNSSKASSCLGRGWGATHSQKA